MWYNSALATLGSSADWPLWKENFLSAFPSDGLRDAEQAMRYMFKEDQGSLTEYLFEKQRLLGRADPGMTERSLTQAVLLGLPFYLRQQFKILKPESMADIISKVNVISVRPKKKTGEEEKAEESEKSSTRTSKTTGDRRNSRINVMLHEDETEEEKNHLN